MRGLTDEEAYIVRAAAFAGRPGDTVDVPSVKRLLRRGLLFVHRQISPTIMEIGATSAGRQVLAVHDALRVQVSA